MIEPLKRHIINNLRLGALASVIALSAVVASKYDGSLNETASQLETVKRTLSRKSSSSHEFDLVLSRMKALIPPDFNAKTTEEQIFFAIDNLKSRFSGVDVTVANLEDRGDMVSMPVVIKGTLKTYSSFVSDIGYLTALRFPYFGINDASLSVKDANIMYVINGALLMPKKTGTL